MCSLDRNCRNNWHKRHFSPGRWDSIDRIDIDLRDRHKHRSLKIPLWEHLVGSTPTRSNWFTFRGGMSSKTLNYLSIRYTKRSVPPSLIKSRLRGSCQIHWLMASFSPGSSPIPSTQTTWYAYRAIFRIIALWAKGGLDQLGIEIGSFDWKSANFGSSQHTSVGIAGWAYGYRPPT